MSPSPFIISLRYADVKFAEAEKQIGEQGSRRRRSTSEKERYQAMGVHYLPEAARFGNLLKLPEGENIGQAINDAMWAIGRSLSDARAGLSRYFRFYNTRRPHSSLDGQIPDQVYFNALPLPVAA